MRLLAVWMGVLALTGEVYAQVAPPGNLCNYAAQVGTQVTTQNVDGITFTIWSCTAQPRGLFKWVVYNSTNPPNQPTAPIPPIVPVNANQVNGVAVPPNLSCAGTNSLAQIISGTCSGGGGGITSFAAPAASWPSWLVPTVTNSTTTPFNYPGPWNSLGD
jgi:hypothetical protein